MREVTAGRGRTVADIDAVRDWLSARDDCTGRLGVIGFCMGGGTRSRWRPGTGMRPPVPTTVAALGDDERALAGACPVAGSYGGKDRSPMGASAAARLERPLTALGVDHDIEVYPDAGP